MELVETHQIYHLEKTIGNSLVYIMWLWNIKPNPTENGANNPLLYGAFC